jgi:hypothetical protein
MKISLALGLALTLGTFVLVGGAPNTAHAVDANHSGTLCKNYHASQVTDIDYLSNGVRNLSSSSRYVVCPLVISPAASAASATVYVDGIAASGQTISCTLYSYDEDKNLIGSKSFPTPITGTFDVLLSVPSYYWATSSVLCRLPPSSAGIIYDVDVVQ